MIRNPLDRAVSHYIHEWSMGTMSGDIEAAFEHHPELIDYGRYGYQLAPWVAAFGRDGLFVSSLEAMTAAPQALLDRIGGFLGRSGLIWQAEKAQENVSAQRVRRAALAEHSDRQPARHRPAPPSGAQGPARPHPQRPPDAGPPQADPGPARPA